MSELDTSQDTSNGNQLGSFIEGDVASPSAEAPKEPEGEPQPEGTEGQRFYIDDDGDQEKTPKVDEVEAIRKKNSAAWKKNKAKQREREDRLVKRHQEELSKRDAELDELRNLVYQRTATDEPDRLDYDTHAEWLSAHEDWKSSNRAPAREQQKEDNQYVPNHEIIDHCEFRANELKENGFTDAPDVIANAEKTLHEKFGVTGDQAREVFQSLADEEDTPWEVEDVMYMIGLKPEIADEFEKARTHGAKKKLLRQTANKIKFGTGKKDAPPKPQTEVKGSTGKTEGSLASYGQYI